MPHDTEDIRKRFILTTTANYFGLKPSPALTDCRELDNFLDDGNEFVLAIIRNGKDLQLSNRVRTWAQTSSEENLHVMCFTNVLILCAVDWIWWQQWEGSGILQATSLCDHGGKSAPKCACILHARIPYQHTVPSSATGFCPSASQGKWSTG